MRLNVWKYLSLLFIISCGASSIQEPRWYQGQKSEELPAVAVVCISVPPKQLPAVVEAIAMWDYSLNEVIRLQADISGDHCDLIIAEVVETDDSAPPNARAWTNGVGGRFISLRKGLYEEKTLAITLHELGHSLGCQHLNNGGLMHPSVDNLKRVCPDAEAVAQVAAYNRIPLQLLRWCY